MYYFILIVLCLMIAPITTSASPEMATEYRPKPLASNNKTMVVTNNPWATKAALEILHKGGNAFDAAIAAGFVLGLTEPQSSGLGGGGYALTYADKNKQIVAYDGRETAPLTADSRWFYNKKGKLMNFQQAMLSAKSIGVPSEVALFYKLHKNQGKLPWSTLLQPAISLAEQGFAMSPRLQSLLNSDRDILIKNPDVRSIYFQGKEIKPVGSTVKNPQYAKTLRIIAKKPLSFYQGRLAQSLVIEMNRAAGKKLFSRKDLANYTVKTGLPVCAAYRTKYKICSVPPSSGGGVAMLELMSIYSSHYQGSNSNEPEWIYQFIEASKLAFADRNQYLADPAFIKQPVKGLLSKDYIKSRSALIHDSAANTPVAPGIPEGADESYAADLTPKARGTTSLVIVDENHNAISMSLSIESQFGSHIFTHGFFLNNQLTDFSFKAKDTYGKLIANRIQPGKRPRSSMAPTMVFDKNQQLYIVTGSPGGSEIICYLAKNLILTLDMGVGIDAAQNTANMCSNNIDVAVEAFIEPVNYLSFLEKKGEILISEPMVSGVTTIMRDTNGGWNGAADPRREGYAEGV